jgi:hypothetical protein
MTDITPPPELVQQWDDEALELRFSQDPNPMASNIATRAAQWGADQELEACCEWLQDGFGGVGDFPQRLRAARRPKPPSLKEQALEMLENAWEGGHINNNAAQTIRRALEALDD